MYEQVIIQIEFIIIFFLSTETSGWLWPIQLIYIFIGLFYFSVTVILDAFYCGSHKQQTCDCFHDQPRRYIAFCIISFVMWFRWLDNIFKVSM